MVMPLSGQRGRIAVGHHLDTIDRPAHGLPIRALDLRLIDLAFDDGTLPRIVRLLVDLDLLAVVTVLVDARDRVDRVLPSTEDDEIARRIRVRRARGVGVAVAPDLALQIAIVVERERVVLDARVDRQRAVQPDAVVVRALTAELAVLDPPGIRARWDPVWTEIRRPLPYFAIGNAPVEQRAEPTLARCFACLGTDEP